MQINTCSNSGETKFDDGQSEEVINLKLPQFPLLNKNEVVSVVIETPSGSLAQLGQRRSCLMDIRHDKGEFLGNYYM